LSLGAVFLNATRRLGRIDDQRAPQGPGQHERAAERESEAPVIALECDNFAIARAVALATDMVLAATHALVQPDLAAGKVLALRMKTPLSMFSRLGIVSLQNRTPSPMAQLAMTCIERATVEADRAN
jgi:DNA-binding transcriptional LysR family regulator